MPYSRSASPSAPSVTACTSRSPPTNAPFHDAPLAAEDLLAVAAAARLVDADLERLQLLGDARGEVGVVGGDRRDERAVGGVHRREQLGLGVDADDRVERAERLGVVQRPLRGRLEHARRARRRPRCPARRGTGRRRASRGTAGAPRPRIASSNCSAQLGGLARGDDRAEVELGQRVVRASRPRAGGRTAGLRRTGRYISRNAGSSSALHDVPRVGGAALLGVLEALLQVPAEQSSHWREVPDAPGVEALLLEEVPLAGVGERRRGLATVGPAADEGQRADLLGPLISTSPSCDPDAGQQRHRQARPAHERVRERQAVEAALARASWRRRRCRPAPAPARRAPARSSGSSSWRCC